VVCLEYDFSGSGSGTSFGMFHPKVDELAEYQVDGDITGLPRVQNDSCGIRCTCTRRTAHAHALPLNTGQTFAARCRSAFICRWNMIFARAPHCPWVQRPHRAPRSGMQSTTPRRRCAAAAAPGSLSCAVEQVRAVVGNQTTEWVSLIQVNSDGTATSAVPHTMLYIDDGMRAMCRVPAPTTHRCPSPLMGDCRRRHSSPSWSTSTGARSTPPPPPPPQTAVHAVAHPACVLSAHEYQFR